MARTYDIIQPTKKSIRCCSSCSKTTTASMKMRTNPVNYSAEYSVLCDGCARRLGFGRVDLVARPLTNVH